MAWWALNYLANTRSWNELYTVAGTTEFDHLWMAWAKHKPRRKAIWKVVRGKIIFCGWQYIWDTPRILEQNRPGDTPWHYFWIRYLESSDHIWYYLYSPEGPYGRECQGPLVHIPPPEAHLWASKLYAATRLKGVYYTETFTGPGGDTPVWSRCNDGLASLEIWQLEPDPQGAQFRQYCIAGAPPFRIAYRRVPPISTTWLPILTSAEAIALTGSTTGDICWLATNANQPGHIYVLFNSGLMDNGTWCLRSEDYGETWTPFQIYAALQNYNAGTIVAGIAQGTSPHDPGAVLYAGLTATGLMATTVFLSTNHGETWTQKDGIPTSILTPRCRVDPTDQSILYVGGYVALPIPDELFRSTEHGANLVEVDGLLHLGIQLLPNASDIYVQPSNHEHATLIIRNHIYTTMDYCATWDDWGNMPQFAARLAILWENPTNLYLGKNTSGTFPPVGPANHVIYVSDDHGIYMEGKAGEHAWTVDGGGDSIPYNCGGLSLQGILPLPPY